ncbi:MAG: hypothetical protein LUD50_01205 [Clostridia bacterium]|nr:hypothetical protein [Clostridia bacterium]
MEQTERKTTTEWRPAIGLNDLLKCFAGAMSEAIDEMIRERESRERKEDGSWE